ncbi:hypothetical protein OG585_09130 [Streptomyces sp. NBC_01340]|uniref:hypothetical protein n=1 Tax=Streptomyces sp. NBC_01340 TaxID=2903830 RepID=UPI002E0E24F9|nr:hypothetical protein OG585_09130 [Streptomyces sp. NBC_01340]
MKDVRFNITTSNLLAKAVDMINGIDIGDRPTASGLGSVPLSLAGRARVPGREDHFRKIVSPPHRDAVEDPVGQGDEALSCTGAVLLCPVHEGADHAFEAGTTDPSQNVMGFGIYALQGDEGPLLRFRTAPMGHCGTSPWHALGPPPEWR